MKTTIDPGYHGMSTPELCAALNVATAVLVIAPPTHPDARVAARKRLIAIRQVLELRMERGQ